MKTVMTTLLALLALLMITASALPAHAQTTDGDEGISIVVQIEPRLDHEQALEDGVHAYHQWIAGREGAMRYQWYTILSGPDSTHYLARSGEHDWADFDQPLDWRSEGAQKFAELIRPHVQDVHVWYLADEKQWGAWPDSMEEYPLINVTHWHVHAGQVEAFRKGLARIDRILKDGGFPMYYRVSRVVSGSEGYHVVVVSPRRNFADMSPKDPNFMDILTQAMGDRKKVDVFMADWNQTYRTGQSYLIQYNARLSDYGD